MELWCSLFFVQVAQLATRTNGEATAHLGSQDPLLGCTKEIVLFRLVPLLLPRTHAHATRTPIQVLFPLDVTKIIYIDADQVRVLVAPFPLLPRLSTYISLN
jgi:hypothetical protein